MIWQDAAILAAQLACLGALWPTLVDRTKWPDTRTCVITGAALAGMAATFVTLELWLATIVTACSAGVWGRMAWR